MFNVTFEFIQSFMLIVINNNQFSGTQFYYKTQKQLMQTR